MRTKFIFLLLGFFSIVKGFLVLMGIELPKRDGTTIDNKASYGTEIIIFGIVILIVTLIISKIKTEESK